jgi:hypothetical protein
MSLKERLSEDLKQAMRSGDALRRDVLRSVLTAISNTEIARVNVKDESATRQQLSDPDTLDVVQKQAKQRRESSEYRKAGRTDRGPRAAELVIWRPSPQQLVAMRSPPSSRRHRADWRVGTGRGRGHAGRHRAPQGPRRRARHQ